MQKSVYSSAVREFIEGRRRVWLGIIKLSVCE